MKSADYIVKFLVDKGVDTAFVFTGGAISHVIDAFRHYPQIDYICVHHEQVGAMAAEGYSRSSDKVGVAMTTSGPGATNLVTGITGAYYDCIPVIYIVGQVRTWEMSGDAKLLQRGFQEVDIVSMVKKITKYAVTITQEEDIRYELEKSWYLATHGRPGPVLIDLPMNMQWADIDPNALRGYKNNDAVWEQTADERFSQLCDAISQASKPLVIVGGGVAHADARKELSDFLEKVKVPAIQTYGGRDALPANQPALCGVLGQFGTPAANALTGQADLILTLGSRLTIRQIGNSPELFAPQAKKIAINIDAGELDDGYVSQDIKIHGDLKTWLTRLSRSSITVGSSSWLSYAQSLAADLNLQQPETNPNFVTPYAFMQGLCEKLDSDAIIIADTGQSLVYAAQVLRLTEEQRVFSSWAHSPMGYSVAAAIGASRANPGRQTVAIIGDGGMHINLQDLHTIVTYALPIKILLFNNYCYGLIQEFQDPNLDGRYAATDKDHGYSPPNYEKLASAFGIAYFSMRNDQQHDSLNRALACANASICEIFVDPDFRVCGLVPGKNATHELADVYHYTTFDQVTDGVK